MSDNLLQKFSDKDSTPDEELIFAIIGERKIFWQRIIKYATENYRMKPPEAGITIMMAKNGYSVPGEEKNLILGRHPE